MNPQPWRKVEQLYHSALELDPAERNGFLAQACQEDAELLREVESLSECLSHFIVFGEGSLRRAMKNFCEHYH